MFKFNKGTHLTILATFAIVFIVIYLYFTITDLRRLQNEVSRLRQKVSALEETTAVLPSSCPLQATHSAPLPTAAPIVSTAVSVSQVQQDDDDKSSVLTEDITKMLEAEEDDSEQLEPPSVTTVEAPVETPVPVEVTSTNDVVSEESSTVAEVPPVVDTPKPTTASRSRKAKTTK